MPKSPALQRPTVNNERLEAHATAIRDVIHELQKRTLDDIVVVGRHLIAAKALAGPGHWLEWLGQNVGLSDRTAQRFMAVARQGRSANLSDLNMPISAMYQITARSVPEPAREAIVEKAKTAKVTHREVVETVRATKSSLEKPRPVAVQPAKTEPPTAQIQHTEPADAPFNWLLFVSRAETNSRFFERNQEEWQAAILQSSQMPPELRGRLLDCLATLVDQADTMIATFEVPTTH